VNEQGWRRIRDAVAVVVAAAVLLPGSAVIAQPSTQRLLVFDVPYARVWESATREMQAYPLARAVDGVIETARIARAPRAEEEGAGPVMERITVRVEVVGERITRVTVTVHAEAQRDGRWQPRGGSPATARTVLDRIRAGIS
jgi:hypothetical protein